MDHAYATPDDDLAAWRDAPEAAGLLPPHLAAFVQHGTSPVLGARREDGRPLVGTGLACRIEGGTRLRVFAVRSINADLIAALEAGSAFAATFGSPRTQCCIQFKAERVEVRASRAGDACELARQSAIHADELVELGFPRALVALYLSYDPDDVVSIEFTPTRAYTQTPGPGAGAELSR